jgi:MSHA pilin protein MshA
MTTNIRRNGFTLIELVVVITVLGILAAFAVPRVASLEGEARVAAAEALAGSVRSSAVRAHTAWLAQGDLSSTEVTIGDRTIAMANGYPDADSIGSTLGEFRGFALMTTRDAAVFAHKAQSGSASNHCFVTYTPAPSATSQPAVVVNSNGC